MSNNLLHFYFDQYLTFFDAFFLPPKHWPKAHHKICKYLLTNEDLCIHIAIWSDFAANILLMRTYVYAFEKWQLAHISSKSNLICLLDRIKQREYNYYMATKIVFLFFLSVLSWKRIISFALEACIAGGTRDQVRVVCLWRTAERRNRGAARELGGAGKWNTVIDGLIHWMNGLVIDFCDIWKGIGWRQARIIQRMNCCCSPVLLQQGTALFPVVRNDVNFPKINSTME